MDPRFFGEAFVTLFVIMDPLGTIPVFLGLTGGFTMRARAKAAGQAVLVSLGVIISFALFGQQILDYLGIGIPALQGAGGLLLLLVALDLLTGRAEDPQEVQDVNVALVPLGTPLLAGPGAIGGIIRVIRDSGIVLVSRIAGLLLSAIAVQLVADSILGFINEAR
jgi:MarC family membrane protein